MYDHVAMKDIKAGNQGSKYACDVASQLPNVDILVELFKILWQMEINETKTAELLNRTQRNFP